MGAKEYAISFHYLTNKARDVYVCLAVCTVMNTTQYCLLLGNPDPWHKILGEGMLIINVWL